MLETEREAVAACCRGLAAAGLGCATAALVAGGLGTDHGDSGLAAADALGGGRVTG